MAEDDVDVLLRSSSIGNNNEESILFFDGESLIRTSLPLYAQFGCSSGIKKLLSIPAVQARRDYVCL
jgi:hypothetical protein